MERAKAMDTPCSKPEIQKAGGCVNLFRQNREGICLIPGDGDQLASSEKGKIESCASFYFSDSHLTDIDTHMCLDRWNDNDIETWGLYACGDGYNQAFARRDRISVCTADAGVSPPECLAFS